MRKYFQRTPVQTIMGHRLAEPRPTLMAVMWAMIYLGLPVALVGGLIDVLIQVFTGHCTGWWCWFS
jgi:hypothetical protein